MTESTITSELSVAEFRETAANIESEVGKVHLGVVHIFDVNEPKIKANEDDICEAKFRSVEELLGDIDQFETWSQISLKALFLD